MSESAAAYDLDAQYDTSRQLPDGNVQPYFEAFTAASERARSALPHRANVRYGPHERETLDLFPASRPGAPLFVWVHGGYWRRMSKDAFSFVAEPLVRAGGAVAILNYPLAPGPSLDDIVASVRRGFSFALAAADDLGADPARVFAGGHSVGAQLAAMIAATSALQGLLTVSGLYDLEPLRRTHINDWIAMDAAIAARNSPLHTPPLRPGPLLAATGELEQPAFHEQQTRYVGAWRGWGGEARELDAPGHNHFTIVLELANERTPLSRALRTMMSLP